MYETVSQSFSSNRGVSYWKPFVEVPSELAWFCDMQWVLFPQRRSISTNFHHACAPEERDTVWTAWCHLLLTSVHFRKPNGTDHLQISHHRRNLKILYVLTLDELAIYNFFCEIQYFWNGSEAKADGFSGGLQINQESVWDFHIWLRICVMRFSTCKSELIYAANKVRSSNIQWSPGILIRIFRSYDLS